MIDLNLYFRLNLNLNEKWHRKVKHLVERLNFRVCQLQKLFVKKCLHSSWKSKFVFSQTNRSSEHIIMKVVSVFASFNKNLEKCFSDRLDTQKRQKRDFWKNVRFWILVLVMLLFWRESSRMAFPGAEKVFVASTIIAKDSELFFWALLSRNYYSMLQMSCLRLSATAIDFKSWWLLEGECWAPSPPSVEWGGAPSTLVTFLTWLKSHASEISNPLFLRSATRSE